jgi:hypothetical protein
MVRQSLEVPIIYGPARGLPRKKDSILKLLDTSMVRDYEVVGELTLENLSRIPHPKLLIYDQSSPYLGTYDALVGLLANCTPVLLPASKYRHFGPLEAPEMLIDHIMRFVQVEPEEPVATAEAS